MWYSPLRIRIRAIMKINVLRPFCLHHVLFGYRPYLPSLRIAEFTFWPISRIGKQCFGKFSVRFIITLVYSNYTSQKIIGSWLDKERTRSSLSHWNLFIPAHLSWSILRSADSKITEITWTYWSLQIAIKNRTNDYLNWRYFTIQQSERTPIFAALMRHLHRKITA